MHLTYKNLLRFMIFTTSSCPLVLLDICLIHLRKEVLVLSLSIACNSLLLNKYFFKRSFRVPSKVSFYLHWNLVNSLSNLIPHVPRTLGWIRMMKVCVPNPSPHQEVIIPIDKNLRYKPKAMKEVLKSYFFYKSVKPLC